MIANKYVGQAMVFFGYQHYYFFLGLRVHFNKSIRRQYLLKLLLQRFGIGFLLNMNPYKKAVLNFINMLTQGNNIQLLLCQHAGNTGNKPNLVFTLNNNDHTESI